MQGQWVWPNITMSSAGDALYVGYAGTAGQFGMARIDPRTLGGRTQVLATNEIDDHNVPAIIETASGKMLTVFNRHGQANSFRLRRSGTANNDDWGPVVTVTATDQTTYSELHRADGQSRIWLLYRIGNSTAGDWVIRYTDDEGDTWSSERLLAPNTYLWSQMAPDGHTLRCFAYDHPINNTDHNIYYFQIDLLTGDVFNSQGTSFGNVVTDTGLPVTRAEEHLAVSITSGTSRLYESGRIGVPAILASEFVDENSGNYYRYTYNTPTGLFTKQLIASSGPAFVALGHDYFGGCGFDEDNLDIVYCARNLGGSVGIGSWELVKYTTIDGGASWQRGAVVTTSANILARPQVRYGRIWWSEPTSYPEYNAFVANVKSIAK